ncbi:MAG: SulP family inorganic anion transporter, partial [Burkholderiaceae bacterium]|nr:SulP family inorganic anion transporter [Burkholderiaceae bacterium]
QPTSEPNPASPQETNRQRNWSDVIAGLSLAALLLPQALAYSSIGNLSPQSGLIALFAGLICYGIFGASRFAIVSATSSSAIVLAAATASVSNGNEALRLVLAVGLVTVTGVFFMLASLARMGNITNFIAKPVLRGFTFCLSVVIILQQCFDVVSVDPVAGNTFDNVISLLSQFNDWNIPSIAIAGCALALLFIIERFRYVPGGVVVILLGIAISQWFNLPDYGVDLVGTIDLKLMAPTIPHLSWDEWLQMSQLSFALLFILYAESYGSIRSFAIKHNHPVSPNRDLFALGVSNLVSGLLHGMPVGAGYSATAANEKNGARSQLSGFFAAAVVLLILLTMLPGIALVPKPVLAAIVIHAVSHTLTVTTFKPYFEWRRDELVLIVAILAVISLGVLNGLLIAVGISLFLLLRQMSAASVSQLGRHGRRAHDFVNMAVFSKATAIPGVIILRPDQALFFANAERTMTEVRNIVSATDPSIHSVVLSLEESPDLDGTSLEALRDLAMFLSGIGKHLVLARVKDAAYSVLLRALTPTYPDVHISRFSVADAVALAQMNEYAG